MYVWGSRSGAIQPQVSEQHLAGEHRQLAGQGNCRDLGAAPCPDPVEEGTQRSGSAGHGPGSLDQYGAGVSAADLGDAEAARRWLVAGLPDSRIETEVADELLGSWETLDVTDGRQKRQSDREVDAGDRHQATDVVSPGGNFSAGPIRGGELLGQEVEEAQARAEQLPFVVRERAALQPGPASDPEEIGGRAAGDQVAVQDGVDMVL